MPPLSCDICRLPPQEYASFSDYICPDCTRALALIKRRRVAAYGMAAYLDKVTM